ncbi:ABC transporter permease [Flaviaesturariibacter terrae]
MKLLTALRSEILKSKRTASFYFTIIGAAPVPLIFLLNVLTGGGDVEAVHRGSLNAVFELGMERNGLVFFPLYVILLSTLLPQIEYRNNTWKQVFAAPQTKATVFLAKFLNSNRLIGLFLLTNLLYLSLVIVLIHFADPARNLLSQPFDATRLLTATATTYITMLALCTFQFWLGLRFRNFVVPIAIGLTLWITGMMISIEFQSGLVNFFPYSFQTFPYLPKLQPKIAQACWASAANALLFLGFGFLDFRKRRLTA